MVAEFLLCVLMSTGGYVSISLLSAEMLWERLPEPIL